MIWKPCFTRLVHDVMSLLRRRGSTSIYTYTAASDLDLLRLPMSLLGEAKRVNSRVVSD